MTTVVEAPPSSMRVRVQKFGTFLSNMVMPNIGAFIAWGLITSLFIEKGWITGLTNTWDNPASWVAHIGGWGDFAGGGIVGPMITYLLPILIGYTGGKMVYETRGGVVGAIATFGVIAGTSIPMFMGAMIMGPFGGWTMKHIDAIWDGKIKPGYEMLVNNFAAGIWGAILATFGFFGLSPILAKVSEIAGNGVEFLVNHQLLPLTSVLIEPAKVLFLNNAINHGVLTPLGTQQAVEQGQSILFLLEANPGPGLGLLLAYSIFGRGLAKASAPGAALIHFIGGIHEIYFPYVLMKPRLILAMIAGGMTQIFVNVLFGSGLRAPAAPGSIIAVLAQTASGSYAGVTLSVVAGAAASFLVAAMLLRTDRTVEADDELVHATASMESMKGKKSIASAALAGGALAGGALAGGALAHTGPISRIVFACDAGMGSSAMGASVLRRKIQDAGHGNVTVVNEAIANLKDTFDVVVSHKDLIARAQQRTPSAVHVAVDNFMASPRYDEIVALVHDRNASPALVGARTATPEGSAAVTAAALAPATVAVGQASGAAAADTAAPAMLDRSAVVLHGSAKTRDEAITEAGNLLVQVGSVDAAYVASMHEREESVSTHMGKRLAIPHGTNAAKSAIHRTALSFVRYSEPIDWKGHPVEFVVGIAGAGQDHLTLLSRISRVFLDDAQVELLRQANTAQDIIAILDRG